jgi:hypothetical protein
MIKAMRTCTHQMLPSGSIKDEPEGDLIGNSNTGKLHEIGCRAIWMMKSEHKVPTNGDGFEPCGWCKGGSALNEYKKITLDNFHEEKFEDPRDIVICRDPRIEKIFRETGCIECGSKDGIVKMYPVPHGVKLLGKPGRWWIYFECSHCGYQTSLRKARQKH